MKLTPKQAWECVNDEKDDDHYDCYHYFTIDKYGDVCFWQAKPIIEEDGWNFPNHHNNAYDGELCHLPFIKILFEGDWKDSLHYKGMPFIHITDMCSYCDSFGPMPGISGLREMLQDNDKLFCNEKCYEEYQEKNKIALYADVENIIISRKLNFPSEGLIVKGHMGNNKGDDHYHCLDIKVGELPGSCNDDRIKKLEDKINSIEKCIYILDKSERIDCYLEILLKDFKE